MKLSEIIGHGAQIDRTQLFIRYRPRTGTPINVYSIDYDGGKSAFAVSVRDYEHDLESEELSALEFDGFGRLPREALADAEQRWDMEILKSLGNAERKHMRTRDSVHLEGNPYRIAFKELNKTESDTGFTV